MSIIFKTYRIILLLLIFSLSITSCKKENNTPEPAPIPTFKDIDGNVYHMVTIGTQTWMVENLRTTHYNDGTPIQAAIDDSTWRVNINGAYCWFQNDSITYGTEYGALYNFYAVDSTLLAPQGWHIPSDTEWNTLIEFLGGVDVAGGKLKESDTLHWIIPNVGADNSTGFLAFGGSARDFDGSFFVFKESGYWWSTTQTQALYAWARVINTNSSSIFRNYHKKSIGMSVRCIKD